MVFKGCSLGFASIFPVLSSLAATRQTVTKYMWSVKIIPFGNSSPHLYPISRISQVMSDNNADKVIIKTPEQLAGIRIAGKTRCRGACHAD